MRKPVAVLVIWIAAAGLAVAQNPPPESVTVTADKAREATQKFVESLAAPSRITGKTARWETPICPYIVGVQPKAVAYMTQRLKEIATEAGAPFNDRKGCQPNLQVIFNPAPDALMQDVKAKMPWVLGYYDSSQERDRLAVFDRPVKAWYRTATRDVHGILHPDKADVTSKRRETPILSSKLNDGLQPEMYSILIIANPDMLTGHAPEAVADYVAMLALAQVQESEECRNLPSIANLLAKDCADAPEGVTINDLGYLRGVYGAHAGLVAHLQKNEIANGMEQTLEGR